MFLEYRFYYCTIIYSQNSCFFPPAQSVGLMVKIVIECHVNMFCRHIQPLFTSPSTHTSPSSSHPSARPPSLSGCRGRRWRRCPCGRPARPSPSCSRGRSLPRCAPPAAPPSAPRPGAGCSAPPCPPGRPSAGRSPRTAGEWEGGEDGGGFRQKVREWVMEQKRGKSWKVHPHEKRKIQSHVSNQSRNISGALQKNSVAAFCLSEECGDLF